MTQSRKIILLLGAPTATSLLSSTERLLSYPTPPFEPIPEANPTRIEDYLGTGPLPTLSSFHLTGATAADSNEENGIQPASSNRLKPIPIPAWRVLPLRPPTLHTGYTPRIYDPTPSIYAWKQHCSGSFAQTRPTVPATQDADHPSSPPIPLSPTVPRLSFDEEGFDGSYTTEPNSSFLLERSYAVHNLPSSQVPPASSSPPPPSSSPISYNDNNGNETSIYEEDTLPPPLPPLPMITKVTNLEDLPSPDRLLNPYKTFMANLLVGIMAVDSQIIKTKYQNEANPSGQVQLLTFTVGDYTLAGLQVKIWLPLPAGYTAPSVSAAAGRSQFTVERVDNPATVEGMQKCKHLVRGDIVLFQDLVLSNFKGVVYANSLRRERSKVVFVYRDKKGFRADLSDPVDATVEKVRRVREWVRGYVGCDGDEDMPLESF
ncbi:hypothetical protein H072_5301 [Dactylellina haptotyla CBS 200.50]|uniref:Telomeric single stranded DNA binding POT1/Cdc13 domain-containing protein n=1 Tax=Dactylellina haptotyla (strain CBS 200.50) TaxID=1284197 RepID=S8BMU7_DACHA|nr:hypothetical protein H072_5301 [Dactylellina haptotyla CBS 200.50]